MNMSPLSIEDQLRRYADAIDPAVHQTSRGVAKHWSDHRLWLAAAAVVVIAAVSGFLALRDDTVQQVDTTEFVQPGPTEPSPHSVATPGASEVLVHVVVPGDFLSAIAAAYDVSVDALLRANDDLDPNVLVVGQELVIPPPDPSVGVVVSPPAPGLIHWPAGTTDAVETVELYLDEWFPEWRDLALSARSEAPSSTTATAEASAELIRSDGSLFATVVLRPVEGRWGVDEILSPRFEVDMTLQDGLLSGTSYSYEEGWLVLNTVYPSEGQLVSSPPNVSGAGGEKVVALAVPYDGEQGVHVRLVSPGSDPDDRELLGIVAFAAIRDDIASSAPASPTGAPPIFWPDGTDDAVETVERFLDHSFPEWRDLALSVRTEAPTAPVHPISVHVDVLRPDDSTFATATLTSGDGRWFVRDIRSPLLRVEMMLSAAGRLEGEVLALQAGTAELTVIHPTERNVVSEASVAIGAAATGVPQRVAIDAGHQEVHWRLVSAGGEVHAFVAFTVSQRLPDSGPGRAAGFWLTREERLSINLAELTLLAECAAGRGVRVPLPTDDELVAHHGEWRPNGILGIGRTRAAEVLGYRSAGWGGRGSPSQADAFDALSLPEQETYADAVSACWGVVGQRFEDTGPRFAELSNELIGSDPSQGERWRSDAELSRSLDVWRTCLFDATGIDADTPNELARSFVESRLPVTDDERQVAVVDVVCQKEADLEFAFYLARSFGIRNELGDQVHLWNEYGELLQLRVYIADAVLTERGITPPSLD